MISIERILCPGELAARIRRSAWLCSILARAFGSRLFLCHYADTPALVTVVANKTATGQSKSFWRIRLHVTWSGPHTERYWKRIVVGYGDDAGEEIVREAGERRIDLIVMRSRRSRVAALLGSTAEHVSRTAPCRCSSSARIVET